MRAVGQWNAAWEPFFELDPKWMDEFMATGIGIYRRHPGMGLTRFDRAPNIELVSSPRGLLDRASNCPFLMR
jgi:hypothetical protein